MELSDYVRVFTRWLPLILVGTVLGLGVGGVIEFQSKFTTSDQHQASGQVTINYVVAGGVYIPGASTSAAATQLAARIHDPGALQINPRLPAPAIKSITAFVNPTTEQITVTAVGPTPGAVKTAVLRGAHYLVNFENTKVNSGAAARIAFERKQVKRDKTRWFQYARRAAEATSIDKRAILGVSASYWQQTYTTDRSNLDNLLYPALPPASSSPPGPVTTVTEKSLSPVKTIVPAGILGLALSFLLAAFLDWRARQVESPESGHALAPPAGARGDGTAINEVLTGPGASNAIASVQVNGHGTSRNNSPLDSRSDTLRFLAEPMAKTADMVSGLLTDAQPSLFITSPTSAEPRVATSVGLASALAVQGCRVILIDADPSGALSQFFGLAGRPGMTDYLGYPRGSLSRLVYATGFTNGAGYLSVLPYGIRRSDTIGLVAADDNDDIESWASGLADLARNADMIIVNGVSVLDTPADQIEPAATTGGAIVVVEQEGSSECVTQTYDVLLRHGVRVFGMIVNPVMATLNGQSPALTEEVPTPTADTRPEPAPASSNAGGKPELSASLQSVGAKSGAANSEHD